MWYPIKDRRETATFHDAIRQAGVRKALRIELNVTRGDDPRLLNGSGLLVVNPPWTLRDDMASCCPRSPPCCGGPTPPLGGATG